VQLMSSDTRALIADEVRLDAIESVIVETIRRGGVDREVACAVVDANSPMADFGRAIEAARFPEYDMAKAMEPFEPASLFLYTVDVEKGRIGHVKRVVRGCTAEELAETGLTRIEVIDDRLEATDPDERATLEELFDQFGITDPAKAWNIATSCATERVQPTRHRPYSLLTYKGLLLLIQPLHVDHFFAYVNKKTVRSLARLGIPSTMVGDHEFHLPVHEGYDLDYVAIHMTPDEATVKAFTVADPAHPLSRAVAELALPVVVFVHDDDVVLDLTDAAVSPHVELAQASDLVLDLTDEASPVLDLTDTEGDEVVIDLTDSAGARVDAALEQPPR
jgi:hypothetical protein